MLHVFPDPRADVQALLEAERPGRWPAATIDTAFPSGSISAPWIQHGWDGTPGQEANRQTAAIRVTVWTPSGQVSAGIALAQLVLAYLLGAGSDATWRFTPGAGPNADVDPDTELPFCTFTVNAETRGVAVA